MKGDREETDRKRGTNGERKSYRCLDIYKESARCRLKRRKRKRKK